MKNTSFILSLACFALLVLAAVFAPFLAPYAPSDPVHMPYASPGDGGLLGADSLGRDMFSRILHGLRYTLGIALLVSALAAAVGGNTSLSCSVPPRLDGPASRAAD